MIPPFTVILAGPTGSGKTAVAVELSRLIGGEIVSADSRQVYRHLDIGTNKAGEQDPGTGLRVVDGIPQHLIDIIDPCDVFSAGEFARRARAASAGLAARGKVPVVAGGTGLYITALADGLAELPDRDDALRRDLAARSAASGGEYLYDELRKLDPEGAERNRRNPQRLMRALEVRLLTGVPVSEWHRRTERPPGRFLRFGLRWAREELYRNIDDRSVVMLRSGMIDETRKVLSLGFDEDCPGLQGIGYRSVIGYLKGGCTREELLESLRRDTRRYAKRQMTWFRRDPRIEWLDTDSRSFDPAVLARAVSKKIADLL